MALTIQSNIKNFHNSAASVRDYALFLGGTNVTSQVLNVYDPLKTGYARLFMVKKPKFLVAPDGIPEEFEAFKHILEYGFTSIQGLNDISVDEGTIQGGYTGKAFAIPTVTRDDVTQFTVQVYEFSGSPVREVLHTWANGMSDTLNGLTMYNGVDKGIERKQVNQTAEFIYAVTDHTGERVEYACLLANCWPKTVPEQHFNYQSGTHDIVDLSIDFSCIKYESLHINAIAQVLVNKYRILFNSLNLYSGYDVLDSNNDLGGGFRTRYDNSTGKLDGKDGDSTLTDTGAAIAVAGYEENLHLIGDEVISKSTKGNGGNSSVKSNKPTPSKNT